MNLLPALAVGIPLLIAALFVAGNTVLRRATMDAVSLATAMAVTAMCAALLFASRHETVVYWFGGWRPRRGIAVGIAFAVDPIGAGAATLAATMVTAALMFSWRYFAAAEALFHVLMLVFLAAMVGFALTGDLFNLFVFFELMGVAAYALTGFKVEERAPIQGAINFGVTNTIAGFLILVGVALVYGRTGALNMAQAGRVLTGQRPDGLILVAFVLLTAGLLVKGAIVPFHLWLDDAHAVAPTPACVLFSGVMVGLGIYGVARVFWTVFAGTLGGHGDAVRDLLLTLGAATTVLGAVMCFEQRHLKRMLAFSTVSHAGAFLIGVALLSPVGLAGAALYVAAHGAVKASLFVMTGILLHRFGSVDEDDLLGRGKGLPAVGILFALGGLALAGLPPFGPALGKSVVEHGASEQGRSWVPFALAFGSVVTGGTVLRAAGRVFAGWGRRERAETPAEQEADEKPETTGSRRHIPAVMLGPAASLLAAGLLFGVVPRLATVTERAALRFEHPASYQTLVVGPVSDAVPKARPSGLGLAPTPAEPAPSPTWDGGTVLGGLLTAAGAVALALIALFGARIPAVVRERAKWATARPIAVLRAVHSGHIGDYVAWLTIGVVIMGGTLAATIR